MMAIGGDPEAERRSLSHELEVLRLQLEEIDVLRRLRVKIVRAQIRGVEDRLRSLGGDPDGDELL